MRRGGGQVETMYDKKPEEVLRRAVAGMLPKNTLRRERLKLLRIFAGPQVGRCYCCFCRCSSCLAAVRVGIEEGAGTHGSGWTRGIKGQEVSR